MRPLHYLRRNPLVILGAFAAAFAVWVWWDSAPDVPQPELQGGPSGALVRVLPIPTLTEVDGIAPGQVTAQALPKLKPGMTRTEVEGLVGAPAADISPATVADGRVTYRMTYEADLGPPGTVRPLSSSRARGSRAAEPTDREVVALEFDATKPGHPLVGVHYPDPLF